jgi:transposase InsO family protein
MTGEFRNTDDQHRQPELRAEANEEQGTVDEHAVGRTASGDGLDKKDDSQEGGDGRSKASPPLDASSAEPRATSEDREFTDPASGTEGERLEEDRTPPLCARRRRAGRRLVKKEELPRVSLRPEQRLLLLDTWKRSGLPARDFASLVGISPHTLYGWKRRFGEHGPAGLVDRPKGGPRGSRLPELTRRAILMMKEEHPDWGCQRISDMLARGPALPASSESVRRVLHEAGYELEEVPTRPHPDKPRRFERGKPNQLWQSDLFSFVLKRQNRRVHLVGFLDDHSRFITGWGLHSSQSAALVIEVLRSAVTNFNPPEELLTDNGSQYVTWRGRSAFSKELERRGIRHVISSPRRPQTLGKIERFWGSVWRELVEVAIFEDLEDARRRLGSYIDYYNFRRTHQGIDGLTPADRFFEAAPKVLDMLRRRVSENALELARKGRPRRPFYLTGQVGGKSFSVHAEGERVILQREQKEGREEVELTAPEPEPMTPAQRESERSLTPEAHPEDELTVPRELPPGTSALDEALRDLDEKLDSEEEGGES